MNPVPGSGRKTLYHRVTPSSFTRVERALPRVDGVISAAFSCWPRLKYKHTQRPVKAGSFPYNVKSESPKRLPLKRSRFPFTYPMQTVHESDTLFLQWGESRLEQAFFPLPCCPMQGRKPGSQGPTVVMGGLPGQPLPTKAIDSALSVSHFLTVQTAPPKS